MYQLKRLQSEDLPSLITLHKRVIRHIGGKKDLLIVEREQAYFEQVIVDLGFIIGAFLDDDLVGYSSLRRPQPSEENFGEYAGLPKSEFPLLAHANGSMVSPEHRGQGLHTKMARVRAHAAQNLGLRHLLCEAHGSNPPSLRNLFALGFKVRGMKYEDEEAFLILHQQLTETEHDFLFEIDAPATDSERQRHLLAAGLIGYGLTERSDACSVTYGRSICT